MPPFMLFEETFGAFNFILSYYYFLKLWVSAIIVIIIIIVIILSFVLLFKTGFIRVVLAGPFLPYATTPIFAIDYKNSLT